MLKKRIGISGKMASGKSTVSEYLIQRYGYERVSFASPIKWLVEGWLRKLHEGRPIGVTPSTSPEYKIKMEHQLYHALVNFFLDDHSKASKAMDILLEYIFPRFTDIDWSVPKNDKWRKCLQEVGGGLIRTEVDNNVWVNYLMSRLEPDGLYICDDLRYKNEYSIMAENEFTLIRLDISPEEQMNRLQRLYGTVSPERLIHPSEIDLDEIKFPYHVDANQDLIWVLHEVSLIVEGGEVPNDISRNDDQRAVAREEGTV